MSLADIMSPGYYNSNPNAAFDYSFRDILQRNNPFATWMRSKRDDYHNQFLGAVGMDPNFGTDNALQILGYYAGLNPQAEFGNMAPRQRGENPSLYAPPLKWLSSFGGR